MRIKIAIAVGAAIISWLATNALGQSVRVTELLGSAIKDSAGQKVGTVKDLSVDLENGRIMEVIVTWGGFLGVDENLVAALPNNFSREADGKTWRVNLDRKKLRDAPPIEIAAWKDAMEQTRVEQVYEYYAATPYFFPHDGMAAVATRFDHLLRASLIIGTETLDARDKKVGKVEDIVVDLPAGRVVEVVVNTSRFLGHRRELTAAPPQVMRYDSDRDAMRWGATRNQISKAWHFSANEWPMNRDQIASVYQASHIDLNFAPDSSAKLQTPLEQGTDPRDLAITARIQKEILDTDGLSLEARAVKIITFNGRVTLRGQVTNLEEKRLLGDIAGRVVAPAKVDNQLMVKETAAN